MFEKDIRIVHLENIDKGKCCIHFEDGESCIVYHTEIRRFHLEEDAYISYELYEKIFTEIVGKRAKKRALHLLEKMDRTEKQLREKLEASRYPCRCIDDAIAYVKTFHYLDDKRYAENFVTYKKERMSRQQIKQKLMMKGISRDIISKVIEEKYDEDESLQIRSVLQKKRYSTLSENDGEFRRIYQYLLRRGFRSNDILKEMKRTGTDWC